MQHCRAFLGDDRDVDGVVEQWRARLVTVCAQAYERSSPSYYNIPAGLKNVDVRRVQRCVSGVPECAALPLQRVTTGVKLASTEKKNLRAT